MLQLTLLLGPYSTHSRACPYLSPTLLPVSFSSVLHPCSCMAMHDPSQREKGKKTKPMGCGQTAALLRHRSMHWHFDCTCTHTWPVFLAAKGGIRLRLAVWDLASSQGYQVSPGFCIWCMLPLCSHQTTRETGKSPTSLWQKLRDRRGRGQLRSKAPSWGRGRPCW